MKYKIIMRETRVIEITAEHYIDSESIESVEDAIHVAITEMGAITGDCGKAVYDPDDEYLRERSVITELYAMSIYDENDVKLEIPFNVETINEFCEYGGNY